VSYMNVSITGMTWHYYYIVSVLPWDYEEHINETNYKDQYEEHNCYTDHPPNSYVRVEHSDIWFEEKIYSTARYQYINQVMKCDTQ
jgi:hypothetical protein